MPVVALLAGASLVVGFAAAELTGVRALGGLVLLVAAAACARAWRRAGTGTAAGLLALYATAFVGSHLLARLVGGWPAVLAVGVTVGLVALLATRRVAEPAS